MSFFSRTAVVMSDDQYVRVVDGICAQLQGKSITREQAVASLVAALSSATLIFKLGRVEAHITTEDKTLSVHFKLTRSFANKRETIPVIVTCNGGETVVKVGLK